MQRLVLEADVSDFVRLSGEQSIRKIKSLEVLHFIKQEVVEFSLICSVEFNDTKTKLDEVFNEPESELQVLDLNRDGKYTLPLASESNRIVVASA